LHQNIGSLIVVKIGRNRKILVVVPDVVVSTDRPRNTAYVVWLLKNFTKNDPGWKIAIRRDLQRVGQSVSIEIGNDKTRRYRCR